MTEAELEAIRATIESLSAKLKRFEADPVTSVLVIPAGAYVVDLAKLLSEVERLRGVVGASDLREILTELNLGNPGRAYLIAFGLLQKLEARVPALEEGE